MGTKTFSKKLIAFVSAVTLSIGAILGATSLDLTDIFSKDSEIVASAIGGTSSDSGRLTGQGTTAQPGQIQFSNTTNNVGCRIYLAKNTLFMNKDKTITPESTSALDTYKDCALYEVSGSWGSLINEGKTTLYGYYAGTECSISQKQILSTNKGSNTSWDFTKLLGTGHSVAPFSIRGGSDCMRGLVSWSNTTFSDDSLGVTSGDYKLLSAILSNYKNCIGESVYVGRGLPTNVSSFVSGNWSIVVEPVILLKGSKCYAISFNDFVRPQDTQGGLSNSAMAQIANKNYSVGSNSFWRICYQNNHASITRTDSSGSVPELIFNTVKCYFASFKYNYINVDASKSYGGKCAGFGVFAVGTSFKGSSTAKLEKNYAIYSSDLTADGKTVSVKTSHSSSDSTKLEGFNGGSGQTVITNTDACTRYITYNGNADTGATASWFSSAKDTSFQNIGFYSWGTAANKYSISLKNGNKPVEATFATEDGKKGGTVDLYKMFVRMLGANDVALAEKDKKVTAPDAMKSSIGNYRVVQAFTSALGFYANETNLSELNKGLTSGAIKIRAQKITTGSTDTFSLGYNYSAEMYYGNSNSRSSLDSVAADIAKSINSSSGLYHKSLSTIGEEVISAPSYQDSINAMMNMSTAGLVNSGAPVSFMKNSFGTNANNTASKKNQKLSKIGLSIELFVPEKTVKSYAQIIKRDKNGKVTKSNKFVSDDYSIYDGNASFSDLPSELNNLKGKTVYMLAFPNKGTYSGYSLESTNGSLIADSVFPIWTLSSTNGLNTLKAFTRLALSSTDTEIFVNPLTWVGGGDAIMPATYDICASSDGKNFVGYTVYYIVDEYETPVKDTTMNLKANELNYIYPTTLGDTSGVLVKTVSSKHLSTFNIDKNTSKDNSYSGTLIDAEKTSKGINLLYSTIPINGKTQLFDLEAKDRKSFTNITTNVTLNHAVNMVRGSYNDKYVVSSFNKANTNFAGTHFYNDVLRLSVGNIGSSVPSSIGSGKTGVSATGYDRFRWSCDRAASIEYNVVSEGKTYKFSYGVTPFEGGQSQTNAGYNVSETINRYVTVDKPTASNATSGMISTGRVKATNSAYGYRAYSVKNYDKTFKFYPEVAMSAWKYDDSTGVLNSYSDVTHGTVYVLGEKVRSLKATAMYGIAVNGAANGKNLAGATKSDTVAAGSDAKALSKKFNNLQVIYAGGNVNVAASGNFSIDLSGFALDQIDKDKDKKLVTSNGNGVYTDVVSDNSNLKKTWGSDAYDAQSEYQKWVEEVKNSLAVDMSLQVSKDLNGGNVVKTYNGYKASVGKVDGGNIESTTSYALTYKNGVVVEDTAYAELIKALKQYAGVSSDAEAKALFEASGINKEILSSIESSTNGSSEKVDGFAGDHWYDETIRTFVVRYYKCAPIKMSNITVSDKIDINAGPSQSTKSKTLFSNGYVGKWYLTVYLKSANSSMPSLTLYDAKKQNYDADSVLIAKQHVEQADFVIPDATTADARK